MQVSWNISDKARRCRKVQRHGWKWEMRQAITKLELCRSYDLISSFLFLSSKLRLLKRRITRLGVFWFFFFFSLTNKSFEKIIQKPSASYQREWVLFKYLIFFSTHWFGQEERQQEGQKFSAMKEWRQEVICEGTTELKLEVRQPLGV